MLVSYLLNIYVLHLCHVFYVMCFMFVFFTEFLPKCYALHLMAFDRHTIKVYLLTYLLT